MGLVYVHMRVHATTRLLLDNLASQNGQNRARLKYHYVSSARVLLSFGLHRKDLLLNTGIWTGVPRKHVATM